METEIEFINPEELLQSPAFSQIAITRVEQTKCILKNIEIALEAVDANIDDLFKLTIYIVQGQDVRKGFEGAQEFLKRIKTPPVITGVIVAGLANPDFLVEIEALAYK